MPEIRKAITEYDALIKQAESLKENILLFKESSLPSDFKRTKTLQLLASAADHIVENLTRMKQRILTHIEGG